MAIDAILKSYESRAKFLFQIKSFLFNNQWYPLRAFYVLNIFHRNFLFPRFLSNNLVSHICVNYVFWEIHRYAGLLISLNYIYRMLSLLGLYVSSTDNSVFAFSENGINKRIDIHPDYNPRTRAYDLAVITVSEAKTDSLPTVIPIFHSLANYLFTYVNATFFSKIL